MKYYAVERSTDHLAHYGVKGMKWGVRKALLNGNEKALDRHYRKAAKKLRKLQDIGLNSGKYAAKSAAYGAAAAGVGTLAIGGTEMAGDILHNVFGRRAANPGKRVSIVSSVKSKRKHHKTSNDPYNILRYSKIVNDPVTERFAPGDAVKDWGKKGRVMRRVDREYNAAGERYFNKETGKYYTKTTYEKMFDNNDLYRAGMGVAALGLAAKSAQNAYRAKHAPKYREKAVNWQREMDNTFAGTKYAGRYDVPKRRRRKKK